MAGTPLVLLAFVLSFMLHAKTDGSLWESSLGEKNLEIYTGSWQPLIFQDAYRGKLSFVDDVFFQNFFDPYLFPEQNDYTSFLHDELTGGMSCPNSTLAEHFKDIRYAYRLITLSYLLEGEWQLKATAEQFNLKKSCQFNLNEWAKTCKPKTKEMQVFIDRLVNFNPTIPAFYDRDYNLNQWQKEISQKKMKWYSQYALEKNCKNGCQKEEIQSHLSRKCEENANLMTLICSEDDDLYGLSDYRDAYSLLGQSNIINTFNKSGEALGCLRRFSEILAYKEVKYSPLKNLFPTLQSYLQETYQERFIQGRAFFYGSSKEFEQKGLKNIFVKEQPFKPKALAVDEEPVVIEQAPTVVAKAPEAKVEKKVVIPEPTKKVEIAVVQKSAFLQAAEARRTQDLDRVDVDMLKLKYDYVFTLNMINNLNEKLKTFMTREALKEMMAFDKLGTKEGPVPLLFLKFMLDMEEYQGLYNIISVLGDKFYVSNEIDPSFKPVVEFVQISNFEIGPKHWQLTILRP
jgi:hypothetical protein